LVSGARWTLEAALMEERIKVAVVEDEPLFRGLLERFLNQHPRLEVVGAYADGSDALRDAPSLAPQVVTLDVELPGEMDGIATGLKLRERLPGLGIVVLSNHADPRFVAALPRRGLAGWSYLLKKSVGDVDVLGQAVEGAARGEVMVDPTLVAGLRPRSGGAVDRLTARQQGILGLLAQGLTNAAIAERLVLAEKSVENQLTAIYGELGFDRREEAVHPRVRAVLVYLNESRSA
jgi:DNA-binding NarL/FixJ family response regulator